MKWSFCLQQMTGVSGAFCYYLNLVSKCYLPCLEKASRANNFGKGVFSRTSDAMKLKFSCIVSDPDQIYTNYNCQFQLARELSEKSLKLSVAVLHVNQHFK